MRNDFLRNQFGVFKLTTCDKCSSYKWNQENIFTQRHFCFFGQTFISCKQPIDFSAFSHFKMSLLLSLVNILSRYKNLCTCSNFSPCIVTCFTSFSSWNKTIIVLDILIIRSLLLFALYSCYRLFGFSASASNVALFEYINICKFMAITNTVLMSSQAILMHAYINALNKYPYLTGPMYNIHQAFTKPQASI